MIEILTVVLPYTQKNSLRMAIYIFYLVIPVKTGIQGGKGGMDSGSSPE
jgi:hypothetical protein